MDKYASLVKKSETSGDLGFFCILFMVFVLIIASSQNYFIAS